MMLRKCTETYIQKNVRAYRIRPYVFFTLLHFSLKKECYSLIFNNLAFNVFCSKHAVVMDPVPPGTGVMAPHFLDTSS